MSRDNTVRQAYLLLNTNEPPRAKAPPARRRPYGPGLLLAVLVSLTLWLALFWLGDKAVRLFT